MTRNRQNSCDQFIQTAKSGKTLKSHNIRQHPKPFERIFEWPNCLERFSDYEQYCRLKKNKHSSIGKYVCSFCQKPLTGASALKNHITLFHSNATASFSCPISGCTKVCITTKQLQIHMKMHNEDTKKICPECGLLMANKHNLDKHINRVHLKIRNFVCDLCDYKALFKSDIIQHVSLKFICHRFSFL